MAPFRILDPTLRDQLPPASCALAVMTKAPQAGRVKTRLVPPLTPDEAAELNKCFLRDTAAAISVCCSGGLRSPNAVSARLHPGAHRAPLQCSAIAVYTPIGAESAYTDILPTNFSLLPQRGDEFGERLYFAVEDLFKCGFSSVCLIDSDSLTAGETGLNSIPPENWPPVVIPFFAFRIMVGCGLLMLGLAWLGSYLSYRHRLAYNRALLWLTFLSFPLPFVAIG